MYTGHFESFWWCSGEPDYAASLNLAFSVKLRWNDLYCVKCYRNNGHWIEWSSWRILHVLEQLCGVCYMPVFLSVLQHVHSPVLPSAWRNVNPIHFCDLSSPGREGCILVSLILWNRKFSNPSKQPSPGTFCSKGSEISLVVIVLCLCLARCQNERKTDCKQAMALVFLIRMSGQAWGILTAAPPLRLHLTLSAAALYINKESLPWTWREFKCGQTQSLHTGNVFTTHMWAWRVYYFPHWCELNWNRQPNEIHNPKMYSTSFHFKAVWL